MSANEEIEKRVLNLENELRWMEAKFHRSGVDPSARMKTLLRMQKLTMNFLIWFAKKDLEKKKEED